MEKALILREIQLRELEILKAFVDFCRINELNYVLIGGTLLGAIRHKGFIPWDDDIDVGMPRPDYDKFLELTKNCSIGSEFSVVSGDYDEKFSLPFAKIFHKRFAVYDENKTHEDDGDSLWIDVMPIDGVGDKYEDSQRIMDKATKLQKGLGRSSSVPWRLRAGEKGLSGLCCCLFRQLFRLRGYKYYKNKLIQLAKRNDYFSSKYVAIVVSGFYGYGEIIEKKKMIEYCNVEFEGCVFKTMGCWQEYLTGIYGDYMKLPPENKRICPHNLKIRERK